MRYRSIMSRLLLGSLFACVMVSACAHGPSTTAGMDAEPVTAGRLVYQGHSPSQGAADSSLVKLELELRAGEKVISTPSVVTLPYSDAVVRQSFSVGDADNQRQATLDLTLRPAQLEGKRCTVLMNAKLVSAGDESNAKRAKAVRTSTGKWVDVIEDQPIQVRMRCSQNAGASTVAAR